jgi:hypothetical protein
VESLRIGDLSRLIPCTEHKRPAGYIMGENAQYISDWPIEYFELQTRRVMSSRTIHTCSNCHSTFFPGSALDYRVYVVDGAFFAEYVCSPCQGGSMTGRGF